MRKGPDWCEISRAFTAEVGQLSTCCQADTREGVISCSSATLDGVIDLYTDMRWPILYDDFGPRPCLFVEVFTSEGNNHQLCFPTNESRALGVQVLTSTWACGNQLEEGKTMRASDFGVYRSKPSAAGEKKEDDDPEKEDDGENSQSTTTTTTTDSKLPSVVIKIEDSEAIQNLSVT